MARDLWHQLVMTLYVKNIWHYADFKKVMPGCTAITVLLLDNIVKNGHHSHKTIEIS